MAKKVACPLFKRRVSSYRFYGIKCTANFDHGETIGDITNWSEDYREKYIAENCNGCFQNCPQYKQNKRRGGPVRNMAQS